LFFIRIDLAPPFIGDAWLLIWVSFAPLNLFNKHSAPPSAFYPLLRLPPSSSPLQGWSATLGEILQGGSLAATSLFVFLNVVRRPRQESEVSLWWRGVIPAHRPRASSSVLHGRGWFFVGPGGGSCTRAQGPIWTLATPAVERQVFPRREGRSGPRALRWVWTSSTKTRAKEWW
jgi:hypothetical protein